MAFYFHKINRETVFSAEIFNLNEFLPVFFFRQMTNGNDISRKITRVQFAFKNECLKFALNLGSFYSLLRIMFDIFAT